MKLLLEDDKTFVVAGRSLVSAERGRHSLLLAAGAVALVIALATVSTQALRAARTDPATVLRRE